MLGGGSHAFFGPIGFRDDLRLPMLTAAPALFTWAKFAPGNVPEHQHSADGIRDQDLHMRVSCISYHNPYIACHAACPATFSVDAWVEQVLLYVWLVPGLR